MAGMLFVTLSVLVSVTLVFSEDNINIRDLLEGDIIDAAADGKSGVRDKIYRWPNATIAFKFADDYPTNLQDRFIKATKYISRHTCIRFIPRTNEVDYIKIISGTGCSSFVGRIKNAQILSLPEVCTIKLGVIVHELIHSIGFHHEMSRPDRDHYVNIHYENIKPGKEHNFVKYSDKYVSTFEVDYDFYSIMHYGSDFFSKNGNSTITTIPPGISIGQYDRMTPKDIQKINRMYECGMK